MARLVVSLVTLVALAACSREGIQREPEFKDWSYRTRDKEQNRYDGYADYHERAEQWQTDPYWTVGEGWERRKAEAARLGKPIGAPSAADIAQHQQRMDMPPERFVKGPHKAVKAKPVAPVAPAAADIAIPADPNARQ